MFHSPRSQATLPCPDVLLHLVFLLLHEFTPGNGEMSTSLKKEDEAEREALAGV